MTTRRWTALRAASEPQDDAEPKHTDQTGIILRALWRDRLTLISLLFLLLLVVLAVGADVLAPHDPIKQSLRLRNSPPMTPSQSNTATFPHVLGTDELGRDVLSRLMYGARISLAVGFASVLVSGIAGVFLGLIAGYYRGWLDDGIMRSVDVLMSIPGLLLALFILFIAGTGFWNLVLVLAVTRWMIYARVTRGMTLSLREQAFVEGARAIGVRDGKIIGRHILPNIVSPILVLATLEIAVVILAEAGLSFLGLGIQPPSPSWGLMVATGREYLTSAWWLVTFPGLVILLTALCLNLVAMWLRTVTDPVQRWRWLVKGTSPSRLKALQPQPQPEHKQDGSAGSVRSIATGEHFDTQKLDVLSLNLESESKPSTRHLLEVIDLHVKFQSPSGIVHAVNGVSFALNRGETLAILGESGSGKTVTAEAVMGILESPPASITGGSILWNGVDLLELTPSRRRAIRGQHIAVVFQDPLSSLNPGQTIGAQIAEMFRVHRGLNAPEANERAIELLGRVRIPSARERVLDYPHQFSGGMRQRVMIAMAIALEPDVLIADEPTTALDVTVQAQIMDLLSELQAETGMGMILIAHDLAVVAGVADRIAVMYAGRVVEQGPIREIYAWPAHPYTKGLLASVPRPDGQEGPLPSIPGLPPDLHAMPPGCAFCPRCSYAIARCSVEDPPLYAIPGERASACFRFEELLNDN